VPAVGVCLPVPLAEPGLPVIPGFFGRARRTVPIPRRPVFALLVSPGWPAPMIRAAVARLAIGWLRLRILRVRVANRPVSRTFAGRSGGRRSRRSRGSWHDLLRWLGWHDLLGRRRWLMRCRRRLRGCGYRRAVCCVRLGGCVRGEPYWCSDGRTGYRWRVIDRGCCRSGWPIRSEFGNC
jgi:hypothetical protein